MSIDRSQGRTVNIGGEIVGLGLSVVGAVEQVLCFLHRGVLSAHAERERLLAHEDGNEALRHLQVGIQKGGQREHVFVRAYEWVPLFEKNLFSAYCCSYALIADQSHYHVKR